MFIINNNHNNHYLSGMRMELSMRRERGVKARWSGPSPPEGNPMLPQGVTAGLRLSWVDFFWLRHCQFYALIQVTLYFTIFSRDRQCTTKTKLNPTKSQTCLVKPCDPLHTGWHSRFEIWLGWNWLGFHHAVADQLHYQIFTFLRRIGQTEEKVNPTMSQTHCVTLDVPLLTGWHSVFEQRLI